MPVDSKETLLTALSEARFLDVLDTPESCWVDFKRDPYRVDQTKDNWEYAKDVAAFANDAGGLIVVGYKTDKTPADLESKAVTHRPVPKDLVDIDKLSKVLMNTVYPEVRGVTAQWFPPEGSEGVLIISIPPQRDGDKPFVLRKVFGDGKEAGDVLGIPMRSGAVTTWMKAESLHARLARADFTHVLATIQDAIAELRARVPEMPQDDQALPAGAIEEAPGLRGSRAGRLVTPERLDERIAALSREIGWNEVPSYFLQALPPPGSQMRDLHGHSGIAGTFARANVLRPMGWHLAAGTPEVRNGGLVMINGERSAVWLDRDGLVTAGVVAAPGFLGWGMNQGRENGPGPYTINALALVEFTLEFFRFVHGVLLPRASGEWRARVLTRGFTTYSGGVCLSGGPRETAWHSGSRAASGDVDDQFVVTESPGRDAFIALEYVYGFFGLAPEEIPYVENETVSEQMIKSAR